MMCFVRGWVGERGSLAGDWKAASFVVFTADAVLSMSEPSKSRLILPLEELSLALRSLCVQGSTGWSTKSAAENAPRRCQGGAIQLSLRTHPILPDSLQERLQRESSLSPSSPRLHPGPTLCCTQKNAAANKQHFHTGLFFKLFLLKCRFSAGKLVTRLFIYICKAQCGDQYVNTNFKNPLPLPVEGSGKHLLDIVKDAKC